MKGATTELETLSQAQKISIHAPVKGATKYERMANDGIIYFNPRSREGSDLRGRTTYRCTDYFNPRSREGSDILGGYKMSKKFISIHAPVKGATKPRRAKAMKNDISIHAPVKGATKI